MALMFSNYAFGAWDAYWPSLNSYHLPQNAQNDGRLLQMTEASRTVLSGFPEKLDCTFIGGKSADLLILLGAVVADRLYPLGDYV